MSYDRDRDRRPQPIAGPPEDGRSGEYRHPFHPDQWDQAQPAPFRPQGGPPPQSQADGFASRGEGGGERGYQPRGERAYQSPGENRDERSGGERGYRWLRNDEERFAEGPPMPDPSGRGSRGDGYGEANYHEEWTPQGRHQQGSPGDAGWFGRGPHAGRGPKGYQRSDDRIRESVNENLEQNEELDASEIEVSVQGGEVTLEGTVPNRWSKRLAEDLVHGQRGVKDVHNRLRVQESGH